MRENLLTLYSETLCRKDLYPVGKVLDISYTILRWRSVKK